MTCPSCGGELLQGSDRCPVCDASVTPVTPRVIGALAADPRLLTPPARPKARSDSPLRDIPGLRKREARERSWRDEVQERVQSRRQKRKDAGLPLFDEPDSAASSEPAAAASRPMTAPPPPAEVPPRGELATAAPHDIVEESVAALPLETPRPPIARRNVSREPELVSTELSDAELADLPLRAAEVERPAPEFHGVAREAPSLDDELYGSAETEVELSPPPAQPSPIERPARPLERAQAAAVDAAIFALIGLVVVYFTGRAARVELATLAGSWRWLAAYLALLAVFYGTYFSGTTGQTPGKLLTGLRVVGTTGRPPGYAGAAGRAIAGLAGIAIAGLGLLPMAFDPARRAAHDRLFRTRVVRG